ncbi:MAG: DUF2156 domain-containing protein [Fuerstiella sp.]
MSTAITTTADAADLTFLRETAAPLPRSPDSILIDRRELPHQHRMELERCAFEYACVPESYDISISDGHVLQTPCGEGAASVLVDRQFWHIAGGLLAPERLKPQMISWLRQLSSEHQRTIVVYNVSETDACRFRAAGFVVNKFGEEPLLNPRTVTWSGKNFDWVRRQSNYCTRAGVEVAEITGPDQQAAVGETLVSIMNEDLAGRAFDKPLRLLEGEFSPHVLQRRRLFVARSGSDGPIEAFLACSPIDGGRSWAFECYRKRKDATRGVTAYLFRTVIDLLRDEGVEQVSLCLVPGRNVSSAAAGNGDWRVEKILSLWFNRLDFVFNAKGQDHFKSRFRPRYVDRYICIAPSNSVGSLWSFLKTTGAVNCNWRNLAAQFRRSLLGR